MGKIKKIGKNDLRMVINIYFNKKFNAVIAKQKEIIYDQFIVYYNENLKEMNDEFQKNIENIQKLDVEMQKIGLSSNLHVYTPFYLFDVILKHFQEKLDYDRASHGILYVIKKEDKTFKDFEQLMFQIVKLKEFKELGDKVEQLKELKSDFITIINSSNSGVIAYNKFVKLGFDDEEFNKLVLERAEPKESKVPEVQSFSVNLNILK